MVLTDPGNCDEEKASKAFDKNIREHLKTCKQFASESAYDQP